MGLIASGEHKEWEKVLLTSLHQFEVTFLSPPHYLTNGMKSTICSSIFHYISVYCLLIVYFALDLATEREYAFLEAGTFLL